MAPRKKTRTRREAVRSATLNGRSIPLRAHAEQALDSYFLSLNGHRPGHLYDLVMREIEEPLFRAVLDYAEGNQSRAADILGINRGTLRKKLKSYGISGLILADLLWGIGYLSLRMRGLLGLGGKTNNDPRHFAWDLLWGDCKAIVTGRARVRAAAPAAERERRGSPP